MDFNPTMSAADKLQTQLEVDRINKELSVNGRAKTQELGKDDFLQDMSLSDSWNWTKRAGFFLRTGLIPVSNIWKIIWL